MELTFWGFKTNNCKQKPLRVISVKTGGRIASEHHAGNSIHRLVKGELDEQGGVDQVLAKGNHICKSPSFLRE